MDFLLASEKTGARRVEGRFKVGFPGCSGWPKANRIEVRPDGGFLAA